MSTIIEELRAKSYVSVELSEDRTNVLIYENIEYYGDTTKLDYVDMQTLIRELQQLAEQLVPNKESNRGNI